jgi:polyphosphate glucokinase
METNGQPLTLCIDIGGSGIKAMVVNDQGQPVTERLREKTPDNATPDTVVDLITRLAGQAGPYDRVSVGFPGVIKNGVVETAPNLDNGWPGFDIDRTLEKRLGKPVLTANDAAVQGLGAVSGQGLEVVVTLGTGLGCALYKDGFLVTSLEMAHHPFRKEKTYEENLGKAALEEVGEKRWNKRLQEAIRNWESLFHYDRLYIGGGNARLINLDLPQNVEITSNLQGLLGGVGLWKGRSV